MLGAALLPAAALGHAKLVSSSPRDGEVLERAPRTVTLTFDEAVERAFVRLEVYDARGHRADRGPPYHPGGRDEVVAVRLRRGLEGRLAAQFRVLSEDGHPVARRATFRVRRADRARDGPADAAGAVPSPPGVGHASAATGEVTAVAFAVARGTGYLAIALATGGIVFLLAVWLPAVARWAGPGTSRAAVSRRFAVRLRRVLSGAIAVGLLSTALAIVLEGATAFGISFWAAIDAEVLETASGTRVVKAWAARLVVWLVLGALILAALVAVPSRLRRLGLLSALLALAVTAPMAGHAGTHSPSGLLVCSDTLHVVCVSCWLGGLVVLLIVVPAAIRGLDPPDRLRLLAGVVGRFSRLAMVAVALLLLGGLVQSVALVGSVPALADTAYGRLVLAKLALFLAILGLGAYNQRRLLPRLSRLTAAGRPPASAATALQRSVALEVGVALVVLAVTSVLVATEPAAGG